MRGFARIRAAISNVHTSCPPPFAHSNSVVGGLGFKSLRLRPWARDSVALPHGYIWKLAWGRTTYHRASNDCEPVTFPTVPSNSLCFAFAPLANFDCNHCPYHRLGFAWPRLRSKGRQSFFSTYAVFASKPDFAALVTSFQWSCSIFWPAFQQSVSNPASCRTSLHCLHRGFADNSRHRSTFSLSFACRARVATYSLPVQRCASQVPTPCPPPTSTANNWSTQHKAFERQVTGSDFQPQSIFGSTAYFLRLVCAISLRLSVRWSTRTAPIC